MSNERERERERERDFFGRPIILRVVVVMLRPSASRQDSRKKSFKKSADAEESRRKREDQMIAIRKEKREEAMAKKRINVGGGGGGDQHTQQIHPNVFDTSDSTAMTHEQRAHAKVPTTRRRPSMSFVRRREEEGAVGRSVFFFNVPFVVPGVVSKSKGRRGPFERAARERFEY